MSRQPSLDNNTQDDASSTRLSKKRRIQMETEDSEPSSNIQLSSESDVLATRSETKRNDPRQGSLLAPARNLNEEVGLTPEEHKLTRLVESSQTSLDSAAYGSFSNSKTRNRNDYPKYRKVTESASVPPHRSEVSRNKSQLEMIGCIFSGLTQEQRDSLNLNLSRVIDAGLEMAHVENEKFSDLTTHIITSADSNILKQDGVPLCPRVIKYLHGMLSNPWIVRHEWLEDSITARSWIPLPQSEYMIQGDTQFGPAPGTQKRREIRTKKSLKLFNSCRMFFYGNFSFSGGTSLSKDDVLRLVREGGAETVQRRPALKQLSLVGHQNFFSASRSHLYVTEDVKPWEVYIDKTAPIIVCDPASIPSKMTSALSPSELKKHGWLLNYQAVSLTWLLNCISCSIMGVQDIELLYDTKDRSLVNNLDAEEEIRQLSEAWTQWRNKKSTG
ncbi:BRCA1-associated RING domain protein 1 [Entomortierella beljakovae]|nr:BRCA1-associated RING domain protein 1 [Entomortierella beljakovae]